MACALLATPAVEAAQRGRGPQTRGFEGRQNRDDYERGYRQGLRRGEQDGRRGRSYDADHDRGRGNDGDFSRGFAAGYRAGYEQFRLAGFNQRDNRRDDRVRDNRVFSQRLPRGYQEPAFARGYSDGYTKGAEDSRDGDRYDPVGHKDYREADQGYSGSYGSKDAYKNNYRAGFRQGYEDGYRRR